MNQSAHAIEVRGLTKTYQIFARPEDRLKQILMGRRRKYYREFTALRDTSFTVDRGETLGIVGRNGSGKSTLLQMVVGTLTPSHGEILIAGRVAALLELGAGFNPEFTGRDNVFLNAGILGLTREETRERFDDIAAFADIGEFIDRPVKTYSSGMYVRLAFAVAINVQPDILVVDEALAVGDEAFQRKCYARIQDFRDQGGTLLFVSHSASAVMELCDRAICLDQGDVLFAGTPKKVMALYHKLIYAPTDKLATIREQLKTHQAEDPAELIDRVLHEGDADNQAEAAADVKEGAGLQAFYDPNMTPASTTHYEEAGARIFDAHLETPQGKRVNNLVNRQNYIYSYDVEFTEEAYNVRFGMLIKTTSGLELGGAVSAPSFKGLDHAPAGSRYRVRFHMPIGLNAGVYFLNAGLIGTCHGEETYLHRIIDAAMFRVQCEPFHLGTATVDFGVCPEILALDQSIQQGAQRE